MEGHRLMSKDKLLILGGGITGITAGIYYNAPVYEKNNYPGGLCASYYVDFKNKKYEQRLNEDTYRFEHGGGHWIHGFEKIKFRTIKKFLKMRFHNRKTAVYFPKIDLYIPYPIQYNLAYLPANIRKKVTDELSQLKNETANTLADWLKINFGTTLYQLFFSPFHYLYTAGLYTKIAPQDEYKTPIFQHIRSSQFILDKGRIGYNAVFGYPEDGLDSVVRKLAEKCKIFYNKEAYKINIRKKEILFKDGSVKKYDTLLCTLPLCRVLEMTDIKIKAPPGPYTSVFAINIGAKKGKKLPQYHWIYVPKSDTGFYRVGFYSNVSKSFLPLRHRRNSDYVSIYVEMAYRDKRILIQSEIKNIVSQVIKELQNWDFISEPEVVDYNWTEIAYTWEYPNSKWRQKALKILEKSRIFQVGRYGKWINQGIVDSINDALLYINKRPI